MRRFGNHLLLSTILLLTVTSCARVQVRTSGGAPLIRSPDWQESLPFFFFGMVGTHRIDTKKICGERGVEQMGAETTFWDGVFKFMTLTLYSPRTAKVWCRPKT